MAQSVREGTTSQSAGLGRADRHDYPAGLFIVTSIVPLPAWKPTSRMASELWSLPDSSFRGPIINNGLADVNSAMAKRRCSTTKCHHLALEATEKPNL